MALHFCGRLGLGSKQVLNKVPSMLISANYAAAASIPKITIKPFEPPKKEHFEIRNARLSRPLSPHLTIYKMPFPSMLSISHRFTGIALTGYVTAFGIGALVLPYDVCHYISIIEGLNLSPATLLLAKAVLAAPFGYHLANGVRHLYWDTAKGLTIKEVYASGYTMLALAAIITVALAAL